MAALFVAVTRGPASISSLPKAYRRDLNDEDIMDGHLQYLLCMVELSCVFHREIVPVKTGKRCLLECIVRAYQRQICRGEERPDPDNLVYYATRPTMNTVR